MPEGVRVTGRRNGKVAATVAWWNERVPVGAPVRYWPGVRGPGVPYRTGRTRSKAWNLAGVAVVLVEGYPGSIALSHVDVAEGDRDAGR